MKINLERLRKGTLKMLILEALDKKPMYAYEIIKSIEAKFNGIYKPSPGSIYPVLKQLVTNNLVSIEEKDNKKIYCITDKGKDTLKNMKTEVKTIFSSKNHYRKLVSELFDLGLILYSYKDSLNEENFNKIQSILERCRSEIEKTLDEAKQS
ncbi:PadR family transcriptional regulator [Acidianus manzaensis]|uniref:PadR family transcriptional regulator n=1 Tax=Acidianus manzaensis TaxID=282676 RepID=A0A1W6JXI6_9CREN|nr:PadR family transcriptional regulator [Acidianus manzaensis]ARM74940.1 PadR family transcriptional regulator [Acidianus manzaensis]